MTPNEVEAVIIEKSDRSRESNRWRGEDLALMKMKRREIGGERERQRERGVGED